MYRDTDVTEYVSVVGTNAFMDFVESIQSEGVELERKPMGPNSDPHAPIVIELDKENAKKDLEKLDIEIPVLSPRIFREYKQLEALDPASFGNAKVAYKQFSDTEQREIVFKDIATGEINHTTHLDSNAPTDYRSVIGYFTQVVMKDLRLVSGYDVLYSKMKEFVTLHLFDCVVEIDDLNTLRNLSELAATKSLIETFRKKINAFTVQDKGSAEIRDYIKLRQTRPFVVKQQGFIMPAKSVFNKIIGDSHLELLFASFLEKCPDVVAYAKNYYAVHFNMDYVNADGNISNYYPDFIVRNTASDLFVVETKGLEDLDVPLKMERLKTWCRDINALQKKVRFDFVFVEEEDFKTYQPATFADLVKNFRKYHD